MGIIVMICTAFLSIWLCAIWVALERIADALEKKETRKP